MAEIFQEDGERHTRESLHSFLSMDDPFGVFRDFDDRSDNCRRRQHPSRTPDTEMDVIMTPRLSSTRTKLHQSYSKRQNLIKRGRALIQRARGSKQQDQSNDLSSVMSSFSIDDGSYKDDLRRSILEEEMSKANKKTGTKKVDRYRKLKREVEHHEDNSGTSTSSFGTDDRSSGLGHPPLHENSKGGVSQSVRSPASHSISPIDDLHSGQSTVNARIRNWEQATASSTDSSKGGETRLNMNEHQSVSSDVKQRTEQRVLYLKEWLKEREAQRTANVKEIEASSATTPPRSVSKETMQTATDLPKGKGPMSPVAKKPNATEMKQNEEIPARTPPLASPKKAIQTTSVLSTEKKPISPDVKERDSIEIKQKEEILVSTPVQSTPKTTTNKPLEEEKTIISPVVRTPPGSTGTLGISYGFPFPQDAEVTVGPSSCNVSELTTTISSKEQQESEPPRISPESTSPDKRKQPMTPRSEKSNSLEITKSLDDMNQMLPGPRVSSPSPKLQQRKSKTPPKTMIPTDTSEERNYLSSSQNKSEPLRSLVDLDSQEEESSIDRLQVLDVFETDEEKMKHALDEPDNQIPAVTGTYSRMSTFHQTHNTASSNSDEIRTLARESKEGPPSDARSIACPDNDLSESTRRKKPPSKVIQADNHRTSPLEKQKMEKDISTEKNAKLEENKAPVRAVPLVSQSSNAVLVEIEHPESDQVILQVASSLTDSMQGKKPSRSRATSMMLSIPEGNKSTPALRRSRKSLITPNGDESFHMSVSYKDGASFDSEKESVKENDERIWRMDPLDSLSDFILQIRDKGSGKSITYHVHKHRLACGLRKSAHLDSLFKERSTSSAHFLFCSKSYEIFPSVLDFLYCDDFELEFTTTNVVIYRWIGYEMQIKALVAATTRFIHHDMQVSNMTSYVSDMENYGDLGMRKIMAEKCASKIEQISELDSLWILMDPDLFRDTVSSQFIDRAKSSQHLSILIAEYTALHKHEMDQAMFGKLTSPAIIPKIAREAALPLLDICFSYGSPVEFEALQKRCALTMATYWKITNENDRQRLFALLRNLPSSFSVDFLEKVNTGKMIFLLGQEDQIDDAEGGANANAIDKDDTFSLGENETEVIGWQLDPDLSYSDWVIRVKSGTKPSADAYYVHKHILAVGKYKSSFFASIFSSSARRNQEVTRGSTAVSLDPDAARVFPCMLNFIYSKGKMLDICTQTIVPLRFLARTFQVYSLNQKIIEFIERDLCVDNVPQYLENADSFNDKGITAMVIDYVAANIEEVDIDSELLNVLEPNIFRRIISSEAIDTAASESYHVPILIAKYFFIHELDESLLEDIMSDYDMEQLDCLNALKLLQIICRLEKKESFFFLTLRDKCTDVLTDSWDDFRASFRDEVFAIMLTLDTETVAQIFDKVENRVYQTVERGEKKVPVEAIDTRNLELSSAQNNEPAPSGDLKARQERQGGSIIMPPGTSGSRAQFVQQNEPWNDETEDRQPEQGDDRAAAMMMQSMPSAPSEEMRVTSAVASITNHQPSAVVPLEELRLNPMASLLTKSTIASGPPTKEIVVVHHHQKQNGNNHTASPAEPSCQIFSCGGLMATE